MIKLCIRCSAPTNVWITAKPYCADLFECLDRVFGQMVESGMLEPPVEEPPIEDEQRPFDWNTCPRCGGEGSVVVRHDWETGVREREECGACVEGVASYPWV